LTLLTAINEAQRELSLAVTSAVVADGQETQNLLFRLANKAVKDLLKRTEYHFPALTRGHSFTASLASLQASGKPTNFKRCLADTIWNASTDRSIAGPIDPREWAIANGAPIVPAVTQYAMFRYDGLHIFPAPTVAETITYEYLINTPVLAVDGVTYKTAFTLDTDSFVMDEEILTLDVVWRYLRVKGRDYAEALKDFELALAGESVAQTGSRRVSIALPETDMLSTGNIPEMNFPGP
jgi:hypothetical protein